MLDASSETRPAGLTNVVNVFKRHGEKDITRAGSVGRCNHSELNRAMYTSGELC